MVSLTQFLSDAHARGVRICEHPKYGGVTNSLHMKGSAHATGHAGDLNYGTPGAPANERAVLLWAARLAEAAGLNTIYAPYRTHPNSRTNNNHRDHLHVDDTPLSQRALKPRAGHVGIALYRRIRAERPTTSAGKTRKPHAIRTVKRGSKGWPVGLLQNVLNERGYKVGKVDGVFGEGTEKALKRYQKTAGLKADGVAGAHTWFRLCYGARYGADLKKHRYAVEVAKRVAGFTGKQIPGGFGPQTKKRWEEIQRGAGVVPDGDIGLKTVTALTKG